MAALGRVLQKIFGLTGNASEFGQVGSDSAGAPVTTKDLNTIQGLPQYDAGLFAITSNLLAPPRGEDFNSLLYLITTQLKYLFQSGVPEWIATENYYANKSLVIGSDGNLYKAKTGDNSTPNVNHNPVGDTTNWSIVWDITNDGSGSGLDADTLDGAHAGSFMSNMNLITSGSVLSAFTKSGCYTAISPVTDQPEDSTVQYVVNYFDEGSCSVYATGIVSGLNYTRKKFNGVWASGWTTVYTSAMIDQIQTLAPNGACIDISGQDIHTLRKTGQYMGMNVVNAPPYNAWWYFDIKLHLAGGGGYMVIDAISLAAHGLHFRKTILGGTPSEWTPVWNGFNDGPGSGLDADKIDGLEGSQLHAQRGILGAVDLNSVMTEGVYRLEELSSYSNAPPSAHGYGQLVVHFGGVDTGCQEYISHIYPVKYRRVWWGYGAEWSGWTVDYCSANVGAGWPEALAASRYSLGTRAFSNVSFIGNYTIPEGEWYVSLGVEANTAYEISVRTQENVWQAIAVATAGTPTEFSHLGFIKSDGTNVAVLRIYGGKFYLRMTKIG